MDHAPRVDNRARAEYMVTRSVLMKHSRLVRWRTWRMLLKAGLAALGSLALFGAVNYCTFEAFVAQPTDHERTCHAASAAHHGGDSSSLPVHHHQGASLACCAAMQAIAASRLEGPRAATPTHPLHLLASGVWGGAAVRESTRPARGVSPPRQEPAPVQPFYRTTFANHAPPARLA